VTREVEPVPLSLLHAARQDIDVKLTHHSAQFLARSLLDSKLVASAEACPRAGDGTIPPPFGSAQGFGQRRLASTHSVGMTEKNRPHLFGERSRLQPASI